MHFHKGIELETNRFLKQKMDIIIVYNLSHSFDCWWGVASTAVYVFQCYGETYPSDILWETETAMCDADRYRDTLRMCLCFLLPLLGYFGEKLWLRNYRFVSISSICSGNGHQDTANGISVFLIVLSFSNCLQWGWKLQKKSWKILGKMCLKYPNLQSFTFKFHLEHMTHRMGLSTPEPSVFDFAQVSGSWHYL